MANDWFQFKQFMIRQDRAAMKVGTDGVLLGAWAGGRPMTDDRRPMTDGGRQTADGRQQSADDGNSPDLQPISLHVDLHQENGEPFFGRRSSVIGHPLWMLDIGTGTGLIALMLAQRFPEAMIDAIEIEPLSFQQACENVSLSQWKDRIRVVEADFLKWEAGRVYDLITCNPPFFRDSLKSPDSGRSKARHDDILPLDILIGKSSQLLNPEGSIALILPVERLREAARLSVQHHLNLNRILRIKGTPESAVKRVLIQLGKKYLPVEMGEISVNADENGVYSTDYKEITRDFYL